ncbi:hypothetical protein ACFV42_49615, partial [Streptomyces solisilvae]|uniref:hypothetical protein n=1 Tax=Streptomyces malaysiensis TaxID=92644 RepID=UPI00367C5DC7
KHKCPYGGDERAYEHGLVQKGSNLFEAAWTMLDSATDALMYFKSLNAEEMAAIEDSGMKFLEMKGRASGIASMVMMLSTPYFDSVKDVSAWALERYRMRPGLREHEPTVGCEGYDPLRGEPSPRWVTKVAELRRQPENAKKPLASVTPRPTPRKMPAQITMGDINGQIPAEEIEGIKNALAIGVDDQTICNMFPRISPAMLKAFKVELSRIS